MVKNLRIKFLLGGKMPEHHCLRDSGRLRNLFGGGAAKSPLRKKADRHPQDLQLSVFGAHARGAGCLARGRQRSLLDRYFFTQMGLSSFGRAIKVSTYLPPAS